jgi:hypothetical protein
MRINSRLPLCTNCIHFINNIGTNYGKCKLFGEKNKITGEIKYLYASYCREYSELCGKNATFYIHK